jgi:segregation and condensation protein B
LGYRFAEIALKMKIQNVVEALIFAADAPVKPEQMLEVLNKETFEDVEVSLDLLESIFPQLLEKYSGEDFPFELRQVDGGYQFFTKRAYYPYVRHAAVVANKKKLSRSSLETLAIIAYRQPVTKPEVEYIRGVNCDHAVQKLLEKKLIEIRGRADAAGKPLIYGTTPFFMEYFGLNTLSDLPKLQEFTIDEEEYRKQFDTYLVEQETTAFDEPEASAEMGMPAESPVAEEIQSEGVISKEVINEESIQVNVKPEGHAGEEE